MLDAVYPFFAFACKYQRKLNKIVTMGGDRGVPLLFHMKRKIRVDIGVFEKVLWVHDVSTSPPDLCSSIIAVPIS